MRILVHGWYHQGNLGDDLFMDAFRNLFPKHELIFSNIITIHDLQGIDAVFIGGGSFLGEPLNVSGNETLKKLKSMKVFYIGVGTETEIHATHKELMRDAKLIAIRSSSHLEKILNINPKVMTIPDLVYSLPVSTSGCKIKNSILILPNMIVVPSWKDDHWKHAAWAHFKIQFAQFVDTLIDQNYTVNFFPMCINGEIDDRGAAQEIINSMEHRNNIYLLEKKNSAAETIELMSRYNVVITQRYHGIVLAEMAGVPNLTIHHHDKLKNSNGPNLSYYGVSKNELINQLNKTLRMKNYDILPIDRNIFRELIRKVDDALCGR